MMWWDPPLGKIAHIHSVRIIQDVLRSTSFYPYSANAEAAGAFKYISTHTVDHVVVTAKYNIFYPR